MRLRNVIAIIAIFGLLVLPVVVDVRCPVCGGSGEIVPPLKFPRLNITSFYLESSLGCDVVSFLHINITASNDSSENETGLTTLVVNSAYGEFEFPVRYDVAANSTKLLVLDYQIQLQYEVKIETNLTSPIGEQKVMRCPFCDGTGEVSLLRYTHWALVQVKFEMQRPF